jgi:hypothetical protein
MNTYIIALMIIQWGIYFAGGIFKLNNKHLPEMIMLLTLIIVFK